VCLGAVCVLGCGVLGCCDFVSTSYHIAFVHVLRAMRVFAYCVLCMWVGLCVWCVCSCAWELCVSECVLCNELWKWYVCARMLRRCVSVYVMHVFVVCAVRTRVLRECVCCVDVKQCLGVCACAVWCRFAHLRSESQHTHNTLTNRHQQTHTNRQSVKLEVFPLLRIEIGEQSHAAGCDGGGGGVSKPLFSIRLDLDSP
jgi:hypothetical protein